MKTMLLSLDTKIIFINPFFKDNGFIFNGQLMVAFAHFITDIISINLINNWFLLFILKEQKFDLMTKCNQ